jgi:protein-S-isoprenylcysteine O-methyltransferase Ste14
MWLYSRAEERMLAGEFGAAFEDYRRRVGRLLPRFR